MRHAITAALDFSVARFGFQLLVNVVEGFSANKTSLFQIKRVQLLFRINQGNGVVKTENRKVVQETLFLVAARFEDLARFVSVEIEHLLSVVIDELAALFVFEIGRAHVY